jgi:hypothetical protein
MLARISAITRTGILLCNSVSPPKEMGRALRPSLGRRRLITHSIDKASTTEMLSRDCYDSFALTAITQPSSEFCDGRSKFLFE